MAESEVGGQRLQKSQIHTSGSSLIYMISFGGVNFVKRVISIIIVAVLGHENLLFTETTDLGVQHAFHKYKQHIRRWEVVCCFLQSYQQL